MPKDEIKDKEKEIQVIVKNYLNLIHMSIESI